MDEQEAVVLFEVRGQRFAVATGSVREIAADLHVTPVPLAGPAILGLVPYHGHPIPLVALDEWLSAATGPGAGRASETPSRASHDGAVIVLEAAMPGLPDPGPVRIALGVDRVLRVGLPGVALPSAQAGSPGFVTGRAIDDGVPVALIDVSLLLAQVAASVRKAAA